MSDVPHIRREVRKREKEGTHLFMYDNGKIFAKSLVRLLIKVTAESAETAKVVCRSNWNAKWCVPYHTIGNKKCAGIQWAVQKRVFISRTNGEADNKKGKVLFLGDARGALQLRFPVFPACKLYSLPIRPTKTRKKGTIRNKKKWAKGQALRGELRGTPLKP